MTTRVLVADAQKCTGCKLCQIACSLQHCDVSNPARARIRIIEWNKAGVFLPVSCQQCEDAPCMAVCPREAIYRDEAFLRVAVDYDRCISCRLCVSACPFGAMGFDQEKQKVFKCDLCDGQPQCVRFCYPKSLNFVDARMIQYPRGRKSALQLTAIGSRPAGEKL
ncbi:MAG: 4Fe-4S dicluster domain-containing protein [Desulfobacterales bacterium]|jgi:Fe-S-cluster-containing hydrogenase component 2